MDQHKPTYQLKIESLSEKHIEAIALLFQNTRKKKLSLQFFKKKYSTSCCKQDLLGKVLLSGQNNLVGFCGTTLYKFEKPNKDTLFFGQLGDLLMRPDQQGKGYFKQLLDELELETRNRAIDALFVFPNENAQPIFRNRSNWLHIGDLAVYGFRTSSYPLLKVLNKLGINHLFYYWAGLFGSRRNARTNWSKVNTQAIHVRAEQSYFDYKKYGHYRFHTYSDKEIIWSLSDGMIINASQVKTIEELLNEIKFLKRFCKWRGVHQFRYICHNQSPLGKLLKETGVKELNELPVFFRSFNETIDPEKVVFQGFDRNAF